MANVHCCIFNPRGAGSFYSVNDCVARAVSLAAATPYYEVIGKLQDGDLNICGKRGASMTRALELLYNYTGVGWFRVSSLPNGDRMISRDLGDTLSRYPIALFRCTASGEVANGHIFASVYGVLFDTRNVADMIASGGMVVRDIYLPQHSNFELAAKALDFISAIMPVERLPFHKYEEQGGVFGDDDCGIGITREVNIEIDLADYEDEVADYVRKNLDRFDNIAEVKPTPDKCVEELRHSTKVSLRDWIDALEKHYGFAAGAIKLPDSDCGNAVAHPLWCIMPNGKVMPVADGGVWDAAAGKTLVAVKRQSVKAMGWQMGARAQMERIARGVK